MAPLPAGGRWPRLGELLVARGDCAPARVQEALGRQVVRAGRLGTNLLEVGAVTEEQLARALSVQHGLPATWGELDLDEATLDALSAEGVRRWQAVPLQLARRRLEVLVSDARDPTRLDDLAFATGRDVRPVLVAEWRLWKLMQRYYGVPCPRGGARNRADRLQPWLVSVARDEAAVGPAPAAPDPLPGVQLASHQELLADLQDEVARARPSLPRPLAARRR